MHIAAWTLLISQYLLGLSGFQCAGVLKESRSLSENQTERLPSMTRNCRRSARSRHLKSCLMTATWRCQVCLADVTYNLCNILPNESTAWLWIASLYFVFMFILCCKSAMKLTCRRRNSHETFGLDRWSCAATELWRLCCLCVINPFALFRLTLTGAVLVVTVYCLYTLCVIPCGLGTVVE